MILLNAILLNDTVKVLVLDSHKSIIDYIKEPNTIIAILAIIVSIIGLWISVRYNRKTLENTIKHNKLSVEPLIIVNTEISSIKRTVLIEIENCGIGTAILRKIEFSYKGKPSKNLYMLFKENNYTPNEEGAEFQFFDEIQPISANSKLQIHKNIFIDLNSYYRCIDFFKGINVYIEYETLYEENRIYKNSLISK